MLTNLSQSCPLSLHPISRLTTRINEPSPQSPVTCNLKARFSFSRVLRFAHKDMTAVTEAEEINCDEYDRW
jgi:hypothetical protein